VSCVVDASVASKWLLPETHAFEAEKLLSSDVELLAPDLLYAEIGNVLWKRVVSRDISEEKAREAFRQLMAVEIEIIPATFLLEDALALACRYRRTVYDSLYLALAAQRDAGLVTADKRLYNAMRETPLAKRMTWIADLAI
jgi:predicted nucleic acid-binding protein